MSEAMICTLAPRRRIVDYRLTSVPVALAACPVSTDQSMHAISGRPTQVPTRKSHRNSHLLLLLLHHHLPLLSQTPKHPLYADTHLSSLALHHSKLHLLAPSRVVQAEGPDVSLDKMSSQKLSDVRTKNSTRCRMYRMKDPRQRKTRTASIQLLACYTKEKLLSR